MKQETQKLSLEAQSIQLDSQVQFHKHTYSHTNIFLDFVVSGHYVQYYVYMINTICRFLLRRHQ